MGEKSNFAEVWKDVEERDGCQVGWPDSNRADEGQQVKILGEEVDEFKYMFPTPEPNTGKHYNAGAGEESMARKGEAP